MKSVKVMPRFQCDFCKKRGVRASMKKHERRCFQNPNRFCDACENSGKVKDEIDNPYGGLDEVERDCPYCAKQDVEMTKQILAYKKTNY